MTSIRSANSVQQISGSIKRSARRSELLAITAELFATRGYAQTTVRDIAEEAGILSGSLYHHFASKEAMLGEILQEFLEGLNAAFEAIVTQCGTPREALDGLVRTSFATIHAYPHAVALYQNESALVAGLPGFEFVAKTGRANEQVWRRVLEEGKASGDFRPDMDAHLAYRFIRDTVWTSVRWYSPRGTLKHESVASQYLSMLHAGVLAG